MKTTGKDRPDYAEFMRKASSLELSPESDRKANHPVLEANIPWGEVILDPEVESQGALQPEPVEYTSVNQPPLIPILIIGLMVIALLLW